MDLANSGLYDGYTAIGEANNLAIGHVRKSNKVLISKGVNPQSIDTAKTYAFGKDYEVEEVKLNNEVTDLETWKLSLTKVLRQLLSSTRTSLVP